MHTFKKLPMQRPSINAIGSKAQYPFYKYFRGKQHKTIQKTLFFSRESEGSIRLLTKPIQARDLTEVGGRVKMYLKKDGNSPEAGYSA